MRVFLDSNVLISAFLWKGVCDEVLQHVVAGHQLITGDVVLEEIARVLSAKFAVPEEEIATFETELRNRSHVQPKPVKLLDVYVSDSDDAWVLASAVEAGADFLVTGDKVLLDLSGEVKDLILINPRGFLDLQTEKPRR